MEEWKFYALAGGVDKGLRHAWHVFLFFSFLRRAMLTFKQPATR
jgi:hypothetical protein